MSRIFGKLIVAIEYLYRFSESVREVNPISNSLTNFNLTHIISLSCQFWLASDRQSDAALHLEARRIA